MLVNNETSVLTLLILRIYQPSLSEVLMIRVDNGHILRFTKEKSSVRTDSFVGMKGIQSLGGHIDSCFLIFFWNHEIES